MTDSVIIKEVFASIQGEGPYIGYKQLFVRFCGCNLHCEYCDTEFDRKGAKSYTVDELLKIAHDNKNCHSISLTGGEPLLNTGFLKKFLPQCPLPVYLETNATLVGELKEIIDYIDYVSADIKLPSCTGGTALWDEHDSFFETAVQKKVFAKVVFDENITQEEITKTCKLCAKYGIELILQPRMSDNDFCVSKDFIERILDKFLQHYKKTRLIPQVHKFLNVR